MNNKPPWAMTRDEWTTEVGASHTPHGGDRTGIRNMAMARRIERLRFLRDGLPDEHIDGLQIPANHERVVRAAVARGEPVPAHVRAAYERDDA